MGFLSMLAAQVVEWILAQVAKMGISEIHEIETEAAAKKKAELDSQALASAKDSAERVAALKQVSGDLFETDDSDTKPSS